MPSAHPTRPQYLSLADASAIADLSPRTLRRAIAAKRLRAHHLRRTVRIDLAELRRWIEADGAAPPASEVQPAQRTSNG